MQETFTKVNTHTKKGKSPLTIRVDLKIFRISKYNFLKLLILFNIFHCHALDDQAAELLL